MLTPERVAEIRGLFGAESKETFIHGIKLLLADRAEIAQELERIRHNTATVWPWFVTLEAIINLAEKLK